MEFKYRYSTSTLKVLNNKKNKLIFIYKNICHSAIITENNLQNLNKNKFLLDILKQYFKNSFYKEKAVHDVLAFFSILYPNLIKFVKVDLKYIIKNNRYYWFSELNYNSNIIISIDYNYNLFKELFIKYLL